MIPCPRRREIMVAGTRTSILEVGSSGLSDAVVFVHSAPGSARDWLGVLPAAGARARAVALNLPLAGRSTPPPGIRHDVETYADFLRAALKVLGIDRAHLVAHDIGCWIGLSWARQRPAALRTAVLISPPMAEGDGRRASRRASASDARYPTGTTAVTFRTSVRTLSGVTLPDQFSDRLWRQQQSNARAVLSLHHDAFRGPTAETLAAINRRDPPALILWGRRDPRTTFARSDQLREVLPSADVVGLEESGHWPIIDDPLTVTQLLTPFLRRHGATDERHP